MEEGWISDGEGEKEREGVDVQMKMGDFTVGSKWVIGIRGRNG